MCASNRCADHRSLSKGGERASPRARVCQGCGLRGAGAARLAMGGASHPSAPYRTGKGLGVADSGERHAKGASLHTVGPTDRREQRCKPTQSTPQSPHERRGGGSAFERPNVCHASRLTVAACARCERMLRLVHSLPTAMTFAHTRIIVAGTFDRLHEGHHSLLHTAFAHGDHVEVWVSVLPAPSASPLDCCLPHSPSPTHPPHLTPLAADGRRDGASQGDARAAAHYELP